MFAISRVGHLIREAAAAASTLIGVRKPLNNILFGRLVDRPESTPTYQSAGSPASIILDRACVDDLSNFSKAHICYCPAPRSFLLYSRVPSQRRRLPGSSRIIHVATIPLSRIAPHPLSYIRLGFASTALQQLAHCQILFCRQR